MKRFFAEFKAFISKGNIIDLAVAVIIGGAFGKIVTSLVNDIIMPFVVLASGKTSLSELTLVLRQAVVTDGVETQAALTVNWGIFLQTVIDFLVISLVVFIFIKVLIRLKTEGERLAEKALKIVNKKTDSDGSAETAQKEPTEPVHTQADSLKKIEELLTDIKGAVNKE